MPTRCRRRPPATAGVATVPAAVLPPVVQPSCTAATVMARRPRKPRRSIVSVMSAWDDALSRRRRRRTCAQTASRTTRRPAANRWRDGSGGGEPPPEGVVQHPGAGDRERDDATEAEREDRRDTTLELGDVRAREGPDEDDMGSDRHQRPGDHVQYAVLLRQQRRDRDERCAARG